MRMICGGAVFLFFFVFVKANEGAGDGPPPGDTPALYHALEGSMVLLQVKSSHTAHVRVRLFLRTYDVARSSLLFCSVLFCSRELG